MSTAIHLPIVHTAYDKSFRDPFPPPTAVPLTRTYVAPRGAPAVSFVDTRIYTTTYFQPCMACAFCGDHCCSYGVSVDFENADQIRSVGAALAPYTSGPQDQWFDDARIVSEDADFPGARAIRTRVVNGRCIFRLRDGRGCGIHAYAIDRGIDHHELKPIFCALFPATVNFGYLMPDIEVLENSLLCVDRGASVYRGTREEIGHYFGAELVAELDALADRTVANISRAG